MRNEFDLDASLVYLNSANLSICPRSVAEAIDGYHREFERNPTRGLAQAWGRLWEVQKHLASFLNADPGDLFLRSNVTAVLNTFLLGVPLPSDAEILVGELEYGAIVNVCRLRAQRDNLAWRVLQLPSTVVAFAQATPETLATHILSQCGPKTKMVLLSHVVGGTGMILPLREIARETRARGILLVVDGAYAPGAIDVDLRDLQDVDFYGCSLYKWMMGPKGTAFGWVAPRHQETLRPLSAGWTTYLTPEIFSAFGPGNRFQAKLLMTGCHDFAPFFAIRDTIDFWDQHGRAEIFARMQELRDFLSREVRHHLSWQPLASHRIETNGPLLAFLLPEKLQEKGPPLVQEMLSRFGVQIHHMNLSHRWYAVLSPHIYNTEAEIARAVNALGNL